MTDTHGGGGSLILGGDHDSQSWAWFASDCCGCAFLAETPGSYPLAPPGPGGSECSIVIWKQWVLQGISIMVSLHCRCR